MGSVLEDLPREGRVAVIRLRSLGDCVLTTPALDILKRFRPDLRVSVMVEDRFRELFEGNPDIDDILPPRLSRLRRVRPHLCLNLHGGTRSAWMTFRPIPPTPKTAAVWPGSTPVMCVRP